VSYETVMKPLGLVLAASFLVLGACDTKVRQQRPPAIPDEDPSESSSDIAPEESPTVPTADVVDEEQESTDPRTKCCRQCVDGIARDTSGDPPGALNCATMEDIDSSCVLFFDKNPMTGGEAQKCLAEAPASD
jgi:hypothetical protein